MDKLKKANLYRNELIPISGKLVERYNLCLEKMGFLPTKLKKFSIDGLGWSPEIAEEKQEKFYLNNGEANTHAIILTPKQKGVPIYNPFHSFDKDLMKSIFRSHSDAINDITTDSAICVDFDQGIDVFYESLDVLKYKDITIKFHLINDLKKAKKEQLALVNYFNKDNNFIDEKIHDQLLASAKKYGDLRKRKVELEEINFVSDSFYTKAFGGVYVLRNFVEPILIFEEEASFKEAINDTLHDVLMYHISHKELINKLKSHSIIECDIEQEVVGKRYQRIKKFVFASFLKETKHPKNKILEDPLLFKSYLNKIDTASRKKVMGVELYLDKKKMINSLNPENILDQELFVAIHTPHSSLKANHQDLIWHLLVNIAPKDVLFMYWYHKEEFYESFKSLDDSMQDWVIFTIKNGF